MITKVPLLLIAVLLALTEGFATVQQAVRVPRVGILGSASTSSPILQSFSQGLREVGDVVQGELISTSVRRHRETVRNITKVLPTKWCASELT